MIEVKVTPQREGGFDTIAQRISRFPEVRSAYLMSGTYDLLLFVEGRTLREVAAFVSERLSPAGRRALHLHPFHAQDLQALRRADAPGKLR